VLYSEFDEGGHSYMYVVGLSQNVFFAPYPPKNLTNTISYLSVK